MHADRMDSQILIRVLENLTTEPQALGADKAPALIRIHPRKSAADCRSYNAFCFLRLHFFAGSVAESSVLRKLCCCFFRKT